MIRGVHAFLVRGRGAHGEVFTVRSLRADVRGIAVLAQRVSEGFDFGVIVTCRLKFMDDPAKVAEACSNHTDAFFQSIESGATDADSEGRVLEGIVTTIDDARPLALDCGKPASVI